MKNLLTIACLLLAIPLSAATFTTNGPTTTNNDDSCDISVMPAATLLVPYFEVNFNNAAGQGETTIITVTNTSHLPQALMYTVWTDYAYPVISFPVYLTGYDVQSINLYDIIRRGRIAPEDGTGSDVSPVGELSGTNATTDFDNPVVNEASCVNLPVQLPQVYITRMQSALSLGKVPQISQATPGCDTAGGVHANAVGYVTIDVVGACTASLPTDAIYFSNEIRYDNVLTGDYLQVDPSNDFAQGSPMVHIRAIPEGGTDSTHKPTNFRRTFYSRYRPAAASTSDGRQPLPSTFAARWIEGGATGFETFYKIWREVETSSSTVCSAYGASSQNPYVEIVRFDEDENPTVWSNSGNPPLTNSPGIPATYLADLADDDHIFPPNPGGDVAGWMYFNLHNERAGDVASQNWIVTSMRAEGRFSADIDATALGNGCTPVTAESNANRPNAAPIGPGPNTTP